MALHLALKFLTCREVYEPLRPGPTTPSLQRSQAWHSKGLGSFPFARRYLGNHGCFLFLELLRCVTSLRCLYPPYVFRRESPDMTREGLSHSEIFGFNGCLRLPEAYRSLPRPSSSSYAQASTARPYYLEQVFFDLIHFCASAQLLFSQFQKTSPLKNSINWWS